MKYLVLREEWGYASMIDVHVAHWQFDRELEAKNLEEVIEKLPGKTTGKYKIYQIGETAEVSVQRQERMDKVVTSRSSE